MIYKEERMITRKQYNRAEKLTSLTDANKLSESKRLRDEFDYPGNYIDSYKISFSDNCNIEIRFKHSETGPSVFDAVFYDPGGSFVETLEESQEIIGDWDINYKGNLYILHISISD